MVSLSPTVRRSAIACLAAALAVGFSPRIGHGQTTAESTQTTGESTRPLRPIHDFGGALLDFGVDTWRIVSSPADLDRSGWLRVAGVVAVGGALYLVDDEINSHLVDTPPSGLRRGVRDVGDFFEPLGLMGNTNVYYAGAATVAYFVRQERLQLLFKELLYSHWIAGGTRQLVGRPVGRVRPRDGGTASTFDSGEGRSFPSGHSSTIVQLAHVLAHHIDRTPASIVLYGLAGTVVFQRFDSGAHWTSDAWIGAAWGLAVSSIVMRVEEEGRLPARVRVGAAPAPGGGLALQLTLPLGAR